VARQSSPSSRSTKPAAKPAATEEPDELDAVEEVEALEDEADFDEEDGGSERSAQADAMWDDVKIEPVELALPKGSGTRCGRTGSPPS
jgi:hypothetical protein